MKLLKQFITLAIMAASCLTPLLAQSYKIQTFKFKGVDEYPAADLMAAAHLSKGASMTQEDMNNATKLLVDSGLFANISFRFVGSELTFEITPATDLYPIRLENFPMPLDKALDDQIHTHVPLYHGKVPVQGGLVDTVQKELESQLATKGVQATVAATPVNDLASGKVIAVGFSITSPAVTVGEVKVNGLPPEQTASANTKAASFTGSPYNAIGTVSQIETGITLLCTEQGFLEAATKAYPGPAQIAPSGISIPFDLTVTEGPKYRLGKILLTPGMAITQEAFDKQSQLHPGDFVNPIKVREEWHYIERQYHNRGMIKASITATPTLDHATTTVSYNVTAVPGPVYSMGILRVDNVTDDLRSQIAAAWPMPAGSTFNEGAIMGMAATHDVHPALERVFAATTMRYTLNTHDDTHTVDVLLRLEKRHP